MNYVILIVFSLAFILQILRIFKELLNPSFMSHKIFSFPERKSAKIGYYLCAALLLLLAILIRLDKISLN